MKKKSLKSLEEEPLKVFREVFRYHLKAGDPCTDWHSWVPEEFHATIRRRLQSLLDPSTHEPKYTTALAENWQKLDVVVCLDDLINAKSIPNVVGFPMYTALGGMGFADKLLEPQYYETVESMLTKLYKKYGADYEQDRKTSSLPLVKALDRSFKAVASGRTVASLFSTRSTSRRGSSALSRSSLPSSAKSHSPQQSAQSALISKVSSGPTTHISTQTRMERTKVHSAHHACESSRGLLASISLRGIVALPILQFVPKWRLRAQPLAPPELPVHQL
jgi:hypothetical protein